METAQNPEAVGDGLYTRKASGLVREIGLRDAFAINVAGVSFGAVIVVLLFALSAFENADLTWPIVIAAALLVPVTLVYGQLDRSDAAIRGRLRVRRPHHSPLAGSGGGVRATGDDWLRSGI